MFRTAVVACVVLSVCVTAFAAVPADEVTSLPGWNGALSSKQYSGYLPIPGEKYLHYWLVESENDPANDPLVLWLNGGPGCSSLDGYFYEQGPYHVVEPLPASGPPQLYQNPNRWNKIANMIFLEMPAGVGFSYASTPAGLITNDTQQAIDNFNGLEVFFKMYPEYAKHDFYITGESYAGMYVPTLALQILSHNKDGSSDINLKGIMVGNGVIGQGAQNSVPILVDFLFGHGLFSQATYAKIQADCDGFKGTMSPACVADIKQAQTEVSAVNIYDIYQPCINSGFTPDLNAEYIDHFTNPLNTRSRRRPLTEAEQLLFGRDETGASVMGPVECIDAGAASVYLNQADVKAAIHVKADINWTICTNAITYHFTMGSLLPYYKNDLIPYIRVLIYNGDVDSCVPYNGNEMWTSSLDIPVETPWRAWFHNKQVAGYATTFQSNFQFITVKGSGHMVPQFRPIPAFAMFQHFLDNTPF